LVQRSQIREYRSMAEHRLEPHATDIVLSHERPPSARVLPELPRPQGRRVNVAGKEARGVKSWLASVEARRKAKP
jgi:hypothetical protein